MITSRADVYRALTNGEAILVRIPISRERGQSYVFHHGAVLRPIHADERIAQESFLFGERLNTCFSVRPPHACVMPVEVDPKTYIMHVEDLRRATGAKYLVFEGYAIDPKEEGVDLVNALAAHFAGKLEVINPPASVVAHWNDKPTFRRNVVDEFGEKAIPWGTRVENLVDDQLVAAMLRARQMSPVRRAILKIGGAGGLGNVILEAHDDETAAYDRVELLKKTPVWRFAKDALAEAWVPWEETLCCSFFVTNEKLVIPMEMCSQVISAKTAGFMGGTSHIAVNRTEQEEIREVLLSVVRRMALEGMRGFLAMDVIISKEHGGLPLSSGRCVRLIEANMRVNGHNQERMFVWRVARRDGIAPDSVAHMRLGAYASGKQDMNSAHAAFDVALRGKAISFTVASTESPIRRGFVYYVVMDNHGGDPSLYDAVLLFGHGLSKSDPFGNARRALERAGLLRG